MSFSGVPFPRWRRLSPQLLALAAMLLVVPSPAAWAQRGPDADRVAEARGLRDAKQFAAAERVLLTHLAAHPDDVTALRLAAETRYWQKNVRGARALYEQGLARHPHDAALRLEYGRMLVETRDAGRARVVLEPLRRRHATAERLLATAAYWSGDYVSARSAFAEVLRAEPRNAEARRQLGEILVASAPWVKAGAELASDDQPLRRTGGSVEMGWFATPLLSLAAQVRPLVFQAGDTAARGVTLAEARIANYAPAARLEMEVAGGLVARAATPRDRASSDWTARAGAGLRLGRHLTARARLERAPYLSTAASLATPLMTDAISAGLQVGAGTGWLGEARRQLERFPDGNSVSSSHAWLLAPLARGAGGSFQAGYALSTQHAVESRFILADTTQTARPGEAGFDATGQYVPYYTPNRLRAHSAIAALALRPNARIELRGSGSFGWATDELPAHEPSESTTTTSPMPGPVITPPFAPRGARQEPTARRSFSPWTTRGGVDLTLVEGLVLSANAEYGRTAYYSYGTMGVHLAYRFGLPARRAARGY